MPAGARRRPQLCGAHEGAQPLEYCSFECGRALPPGRMQIWIKGGRSRGAAGLLNKGEGMQCQASEDRERGSAARVLGSQNEPRRRAAQGTRQRWVQQQPRPFASVDATTAVCWEELPRQALLGQSRAPPSGLIKAPGTHAPWRPGCTQHAGGSMLNVASMAALTASPAACRHRWIHLRGRPWIVHERERDAPWPCRSNVRTRCPALGSLARTTQGILRLRQLVVPRCIHPQTQLQQQGLSAPGTGAKGHANCKRKMRPLEQPPHVAGQGDHDQIRGHAGGCWYTRQPRHARTDPCPRGRRHARTHRRRNDRRPKRNAKVMLQRSCTPLCAKRR